MKTYSCIRIPSFSIKSWTGSTGSGNHHGINQAHCGSSSLDILKRAASGERFRCVEYASVTRDVLIAFGHPARSVNILSADADYGGVGKGHMGTEVWSDDLDK
ncbi:hypothetical protein [Bacillus sp. SLBN-3]